MSKNPTSMALYAGGLIERRCSAHSAAFSDTSHQMTQFQRRFCITYSLLITLLTADSGFGKWLWLAGWPISPPHLTSIDHSLVSTATDSGVSVKVQVSQYPKNLCVCKTFSLKCSQCHCQCFTPAFDKSHCLTEKGFVVQPSANKIQLIVFCICAAEQKKPAVHGSDQRGLTEATNSAISHNVRNFLFVFVSLSVCSLRTEKAIEMAFSLWWEIKGLRCKPD